MQMTYPGQDILQGPPTSITPLKGDYMPMTTGVAPGPVEPISPIAVPWTMPPEVEPNTAMNPSTNNSDPRSGYDQI
jgi:hypothetical protein